MNEICIVCGDNQLKPLWYIAEVYTTEEVYLREEGKIKVLTLMRCSNCGLVYAKPKNRTDI